MQRNLNFRFETSSRIQSMTLPFYFYTNESCFAQKASQLQIHKISSRLDLFQQRMAYRFFHFFQDIKRRWSWEWVWSSHFFVSMDTTFSEWNGDINGRKFSLHGLCTGNKRKGTEFFFLLLHLAISFLIPRVQTSLTRYTMVYKEHVKAFSSRKVKQ